MLRLQNFQVQLSRRVFNVNNKKLLRISVGNITKITTQTAKYINEQSIEWSQAIIFPILYNKEFMFQIYDVHQFGYNPDELATLYGKLTIDSLGDSKGTWEIFTEGQQKIGYLTANIGAKSQATNKSVVKQIKEGKKINPQDSLTPAQKNENQKTLKIRSMVARIPNMKIKLAYIIVEVGQKIMKTPELRSRAGQLVFIQQKKIPLDHQDTDAKIKVYSVKQGISEQFVAQGVLQLVGQKPSKKVRLMSDGLEVGQVYIQSKIGGSNQLMNSSKINRSRIINASQISATQQIHEEAFLNSRAKNSSPTRNIDYTRLEDFGINSSKLMKPSFIDSSMISNISAKRRSVLHQNNNIAFPKEKRFMIYQDKQNQRISYLSDRSFQFRSPTSGGRYYRGASIGYGDKVDFARAKKQNPGVGNYKLPSIWDRY